MSRMPREDAVLDSFLRSVAAHVLLRQEPDEEEDEEDDEGETEDEDNEESSDEGYSE